MSNFYWQRATEEAPSGNYFGMIDGTEERGEIICSALVDCREQKPLSNYVELGAWVETYLTRWDETRILPLNRDRRK